ncbi:MAG: hypothetical protein QM804_13935 [Propionicimonas sp.]
MDPESRRAIWELVRERVGDHAYWAGGTSPVALAEHPLRRMAGGWPD